MPLTRICLKFSYTYPHSHSVFFYSTIFRSRYGPIGGSPSKLSWKCHQFHCTINSCFFCFASGHRFLWCCHTGRKLHKQSSTGIGFKLFMLAHPLLTRLLKIETPGQTANRPHPILKKILCWLKWCHRFPPFVRAIYVSFNTFH